MKDFSRRKIFTSVIIVISLLAATASVVYAAFLSAGHRKGVAVANGYYFTSNILSPMDSIDAAPNSYLCVEAANSDSTPLTVKIMNFDSNLAADPFPITFKLYYQLVNESAGSGNYSYTVNYNGTPYHITSTEGTISGITLASSQLSTETFTVTFTKSDENAVYTDAAAIRLIAKPDSPDAVTDYIIGSDISLSAGTASFTAEGSFDVTGNTNGYAGFLYNVTTGGNIPAGESASITLTWPTAELELDKQNQYYSQIDTESVQDKSVLTVTVDTGQYLSFAFFRADGWTGNFDPANPGSDFTMSYETADVTP